MADEITQVVKIKADIAELLTGLKKTEGEFRRTFGQIQGIGRSIGNTLGISLTGAALVGFGKSALTAIGNLQDLADATGFQADTLLKLKPILLDAGTNVEEFARGVNAMQKLIVEGSPDVVDAMGKMGISVQEMLRFADDPEGLVDRLAQGLKNLSTQAERVAVTRTLLARGGPKIAVALGEIERRGGMEGIRGEESIISKEQIAAVDRLGAEYDTLKTKAEAFAAVSILTLVDDFRDLKREIQDNAREVLLFKGILATIGEARQLRQSVADAKAGAKIGGAAGLLPESSTGPKETDQQRDFKKALDDQIQSLEAQRLALTSSHEASIAMAAGLIETKAATLGLAKDNADLVRQLDQFKAKSLEIRQAQFADQLEKQNRAIEIQIAEMTKGRQAAEELALKYALLDSNLENVGEAALAAADRQRKLNAEQAQAVVPQVKRELSENIETAQRKQVALGITFNADEAVRSAIEQAIDKLVSNPDPRVQKLALQAALELKPQLDQARLKAIQTELGTALGTDAEYAKVLNRTFTNTFDVAAAKVQALEAALQRAKAEGVDPMSEGVQKMAAQLDQARLAEAAAGVARELQIAANEAEVFGRSFDLGSANISVIQGKLQDLIRQGLSPANAEVQKLTAQLRDAQIADVFYDLDKELRDAAAAAEVLGGAIDLPAQTVDALTDAIKRLIAEGLDPLDPRIQELKRQLEDAKAAERFTTAMKDVSRSIADTIVNFEPKNWKQQLDNLAKQIRRSLTEAFITKPLEEWIQQQANDLFKVLFPGMKLPGSKPDAAGVASQQFALSTNQFSAAVAQFAASIGLRSGVPGEIFLPGVNDEVPETLGGEGGYYSGNEPGTPAIPTPFGPILLPDGDNPLIEIFRQSAPRVTGIIEGCFGTSTDHLSVRLKGIFDDLGLWFKEIVGGDIGMDLHGQKPPGFASWDEQLQSELANEGGYYSGTDPGVPVDDGGFGAQIAALIQGGTVALESTLAATQAAIQALSTSATAALQASQAVAETTITTTSTVAQAGIEAVQGVAIAAIEATAAAAQASGGGGGLPGMGGGMPGMGGGESFMNVTDMMPMDLGGGEAAGGAASSFDWSSLFSWISFAHDGGPIGADTPELAAKIKAGLKHDERLLVGQDGEFMMRKEAVQAIGLDRLEYANEKLELPYYHSGGALGNVADMPVVGGPGSSNPRMDKAESGRGGKMIGEVHLHGVQDFDSFRRSESQFEADLARVVKRVMKDNT